MPATIELVRQFHAAFGHPIRDEPQMLSQKEKELRVKLIAEELIEYAMALGVQLAINSFPTMHDDIKEKSGQQYLLVEAWPESQYMSSTVLAADALADLDYVVAGAALCHGFPHTLLVNEVHHSNMSKLGVNGKPIKREDGKILKGPDYFEPELESILRMHGMRDE